MAKLSRDDVLKLAQLAKLKLSDEEIEEFTKELSDLLVYVEKLQAVDVDGLEPTNQVNGLVNITRQDEIRDYGYQPLDLLNNVSSVEDNQIKAKRMVG